MRSNRSPLAVMFLTIFIDLMGFGIIIPILPNLSVGLTGNKSSLAVAGVYALFNFIFAPLWGSLSDKYGRRPIILVSILLTAGANFMFGYVTTFWLLIIQRALAGIGSANISAANAYIADISTPENRTKNMGLVGAAFGLGFVFGPFFGGLVYSNYDILGVGVFSASLSVLNFIMAYFMLPESIKEKQSNIKFQLKPITQLIAGMKINIVRELFTLNFVFTLAFSMMYVTVAVLWKDFYGFTELQIGYVFSYIGITSAVVQGLLVGPMNRRFGERKLLYMGLVFGALGLMTLPFVPPDQFWIELVALTFIALANGCITPSILGLLSNSIGPREQGSMLGLNQSTGALARVFGPALGGMFFDFDYRAPYLIAGLICLASLYIVYDLIKNKIDKAVVKQ
jgi:MFS transporter, DHA1 family, tetracycline resistance protein